ncbi:LAMI_0G02432g1_1 [Lachancea mirantina]|uniref:LAMI_0G02432g1_1 n=1 Tax=Lachancea mirantina TaxID=1230905 RepID=A0A1G4K7S0_9SACH|nr:LAMI_0G02432g1_1 [Lachancea mirantina]
MSNTPDKSCGKCTKKQVRGQNRIQTVKIQAASTPKRSTEKSETIRGGGNVAAADRFIPKKASQQAYRAMERLKTIDFETCQLSEQSLSPTHLSSPDFFVSLRSTRHYNSITATAAPETPDTSSKQAEDCPSRQKIHRCYIADALGFQSAGRVYQFSPSVSRKLQNAPTAGTEGQMREIALNHLTIDPLVSLLPPRQAAAYLTSQAFSGSLGTRSMVPVNARLARRPKSHAPYRVLDAPSLRNDFYSNLVSWSPITHSIVVGLGSAVYIWSDTRGAINVLHYSYLHSRNDLVTCVSFSPYDELLVVGTKQGRLMLFDQQLDINATGATSKPLCFSGDKTIKGICCIEWFEIGDKSALLVGGETGDVHVVEVQPNFEDTGVRAGASTGANTDGSAYRTGRPSGLDGLNSGYSHGNDYDRSQDLEPEESFPSEVEASTESVNYKRNTGGVIIKWTLATISRFKAQTQQVCGLSLNEQTRQLAIGGNDNTCTIWDIQNLCSPVLQFVLPHKAAVKAVAFCPWSKSLLATGGGSKDRTMRFWHTQSGTLLQEIKAPGQITSLIWSVTHAQIVATFGFGDIEKPALITVYTYPSLEPVMEVRSATALRVLSAVSSPDFSSICVATNDETIRFYKLWGSAKSRIQEAHRKGIYGSDLIEFHEGIHDSDSIIR